MRQGCPPRRLRRLYHAVNLPYAAAHASNTAIHVDYPLAQCWLTLHAQVILENCVKQSSTAAIRLHVDHNIRREL